VARYRIRPRLLKVLPDNSQCFFWCSLCQYKSQRSFSIGPVPVPFKNRRATFLGRARFLFLIRYRMRSFSLSPVPVLNKKVRKVTFLCPCALLFLTRYKTLDYGVSNVRLGYNIVARSRIRPRLPEKVFLSQQLPVHGFGLSWHGPGYDHDFQPKKSSFPNNFRLSDSGAGFGFDPRICFVLFVLLSEIFVHVFRRCSFMP
jgi:hypothetical protein